MSNQNKVAEKVFDGVASLLGLFCRVGVCGFKRVMCAEPWLSFWGFMFGCLYLTYHDRYLAWIYKFWPWLFHEGTLSFLVRIHWRLHFLFFVVFLGGVILILLGIFPYRQKRFYQKKLDVLGLSSGNGISPKILSVTKEEHKTKLLIDSLGIGKERYETKKGDFMASFGSFIESFRQGRSPRYIEIFLTSRLLPKSISFFAMEREFKKPYSFLVGESLGGSISATMDTLPHLLIAGSTGGGKSVFFKQALLGLLKSSENLQMYLLDLKGGLEMRDFKILPNIEVAKNEKQAVHLLERIRDEMRRRFAFLESKGHKEIIPQRDKMDKIILGIDEASELYTRVQRGNSKWILYARELTDELAKLSRAAGIHLIFATQKINKDTIDPKVQENIGGRLCFKTNTLENSLRALGNKMAFELMDIKGRGVWGKGSQFLEIQAPFISDENLKEELRDLAKEYQSKEKRFFGSMIKLSKDIKREKGDELSKQRKPTRS